MTDLPFQAEYAKSGRAACKGCKQKIDQGALRIAIMVQSAFFDGKQPNWHHEDCFFKKQRPNSASDIGNFNKLKTVDQKRIKSTMENSTGIVMPVEKPKGKGKSKKRAADDSTSDAIAESTNLALKDYLVEYSKSSRATCKHCDIKICKDEVRISKTVYDTEVGSKYGGQPLWHHVKCFAERRSEFHFFAGGESLPGFNTLKKEDQALVKKEIKPFKVDEVPVKKLKVEPKNAEELKEEKDKEKKLAKQNKLYFKYRGALSELSKPHLEELLEVNSQEIPVGKDECLDRLADCMAFGILEPCTECKHGQLVLDTFGYKCTGNLTEWTKCSHVTQNPKRAPMTIPKAFKEGSIFKSYKPKTDVRLFESERVPLLVVVKNEATDTSLRGDSDADAGPSPNCGSNGSQKQHDEERWVIGEVFSLRRTAYDEFEEEEQKPQIIANNSRASDVSPNHPPSSEQQMQETPLPSPASQTLSDSRAEPAVVAPAPTKQQETSRRNTSLNPRQSCDVHQGLSQDYLAIAKSNAESLRILAEATKMHAEATKMQAEASLLFTNVKKEMPVPPLKNLQFFLYGKLKSKEETKKRILKLGGLVVSKLTATCVAVVSTKKDVERMPDKMEEIKSMDIEVVEESFLDLIQQDGTISKSLELIKENNIADWGSDPATRVPQEVLDGKSIPKSGSLYVKSSKSAVKLKIQGGTAVDPASNLQDEAHVYTDYDGTKYTVVLSKTDVVAQKNSYYKMQVLESDGKKRYWLFRSWGRIGTTIGGSKVENCESRDEAVRKFKEVYMERTDNSWKYRDTFMKVPGRYFPLDMDYGTDDTGPQNLAVDAKCDLPVPVQTLVIKIFDVDVMKKTLLEFELDTEKMPLGKLSKKQIKSGYKILSELLKLIEKGSTSQSKLIDATNRFFTLIPHDFGMNNAPLLDNVELITTKTAMLDNLLEIEIAYSLMKSDSAEESPISAHYLKLKAHIAPLPTSSPEFEMIQEYVRNTHAATHSTFTLDIEQVFKVVRDGEDKRFKPFKKLHNRRLLWHGSRITNFAGIISQGLRIAPPEAPVTGYMFGKGVYFADMVSKSANYCCTNTRNPTGLMLLCEVALGNMKECHHAENVQLPPNMHSAWGVGKTMPDPAQNRTLDDGTIVPLGKPVPNKVATQLLYNEFIVYDVAQVNVKYLLQMKFNHKY